MKFNMLTPMLDLQGKEVQLDGSVLTLRRVVQFAIMSQIEGDDRLDVDTKVQLYRLAMKAEQTEMALQIKDRDLLLKRINKCFGPLVVGRVKDILDPEVVETAAAPEA